MLKEFDREMVFEAIYNQNYWGGRQSRSGTGSDDAQTANAKKFIATVIDQYNIRSMLDIPCGDYHWMQDVALPERFHYVGADVVGQIIEDNKANHPYVDFRKLDLVSDEIPLGFDLILVRDLLGHLNHKDTVAAITGIRKARPRYLLATTFPGSTENPHIRTGQWRPINLEHYGLKPILAFDEGLMREDGTNIGKYLGFYLL